MGLQMTDELPDIDAPAPRPERRRWLRPPKPGAWRRLAWGELFSGLLIFSVAFTWGVAAGMDASFSSSLDRLSSRFRWLVLVQGNQLQVDEVGRFLKTLDGTASVSFLSPEELVKPLKNDPLLGDDSTYVDARYVPPSWSVNWTSDMLRDTARLRDIQQDVRNFPGVVDVAYDGRALDLFQQIHVHELQVKAGTAFFRFLMVLLLALMLGRLAFFTSYARKPAPRDALRVLGGAAWWFLGLMAAASLFGTAAWPSLAVGAALGLVRALWRARADA